MSEPYLAVDTDRDGEEARADCGCTLRLTDAGAELHQCPMHAAAPAMAEALRNCAGTLAACRRPDGSWTDFPAAIKRALLTDALAALKQAKGE